MSQMPHVHTYSTRNTLPHTSLHQSDAISSCIFILWFGLAGSREAISMVQLEQTGFKVVGGNSTC